MSDALRAKSSVLLQVHVSGTIFTLLLILGVYAVSLSLLLLVFSDRAMMSNGVEVALLALCTNCDCGESLMSSLREAASSEEGRTNVIEVLFTKGVVLDSHISLPPR